MNINEKLFQEIEVESRKLDKIKNKIGNSLYFLFRNYTYSINKKFLWIKGITLKIGNYKARIRTNWDDNYYIFKVYINRKKVVHVSHYKDSSGYAPVVEFVDINNLLELQDFYNKIVELTTEKLLIKKEKFDELSNFTLALKELG